MTSPSTPIAPSGSATSDGERPAILLAIRVSAALRESMERWATVLGPFSTDFKENLRALPEGAHARVRAVIAMGVVRIDDSDLASLPSLGLICCYGSGYEGVDQAAARARGVRITHGIDTNASSVAEMALGLMISSARNMTRARDYLRSGRWQGNAGERMQPERGLVGRRVGIFGLGSIGERIAARAQPFEVEIGYHNRRQRNDVPYRYFADLRSLARWADMLVIAARADASNHHAVDDEVLRLLGPEGFVVNVSRGSIIDQAALLAALRDRVIAGAGLDVYEHEPDVPAELYEFEHVALTPHIAGSTLEARDRMDASLLANLSAYFEGRPLHSPVPD